MASRVNMKFVVWLSAGLVCLATAVAIVSYVALSRSGEDSMRAGDEALAKNDIAKAVSFYSRAVNKDQRNTEYLTKWITALEKFIPTPRQAYEDTYKQQYIVALRGMCDADRKNPAPFRKYLDLNYDTVQKFGGNLRSWEDFILDYEDMTKRYAGDEKGKDGLRRYRGLARFGVLMASPDVSNETVDGGLADLLAAIAVDPNDAESVIKASAFESVKAKRLRDRGDAAAADQLTASARQRLEAFARTDAPLAPRAMLEVLRQDIAEKSRTAKDQGDVVNVIKTFSDRIQAAVDRIKAQPPEQTDAVSANMAATFAIFALPNGPAVATELLEHVKKGHATDPIFLLAWARSDLSRGETANASRLAKEVAALPDRPMSVDGRFMFAFRAKGVELQSDAAFLSWEKATDAATREQIVKEIKAIREDLASKVGETSSEVLAVDARLALISGDKAGARSLVTRYNDLTQASPNVQMIMLEGQLLLEAGSRGAAKQRFERVLTLDKTNARALLGMAQIHRADNNYIEAARFYEMAAQVMPDNAALRLEANNMTDLARSSVDIKDPVLRCLKQAQDQTTGVGADVNAAATTLRECLKTNPGELRLSLGLVRVLAAQQKRDEALQVLNAALLKNPDDKSLLSFKKALETTDPYAYTMGVIDQAPNMSEVQKSLLRFDLCRRLGPERAAEAQQHLKNAVDLAPEDPDVVEVLFTLAVNELNMPEIDRLAALAERLNLDKVNGLLYKARKEIAQAMKETQGGDSKRAAQKVVDAGGTLRSVVEKDKLNLVGWRLLGLVYSDQGRHQEAVDALAKAVEIKPDDLASINSYLRALVAAGRMNDALAFARKSETFGAGDPAFVDMLITLESVAPGGNVEKAITARQRQAERLDPKSPQGIGNKQQLASLLINADRLADAGKVIDELYAANPDDLNTIEILAGLKGRQGDIPGAIELYNASLNKIPEDKRTVMPYINAARLLLQLSQPDAAIGMLEKGRPYQDKKFMLIDREVGDVNFGLSRMDKAAAAYQTVLDAGVEDFEMAVHKRILEAYLAQRKLAEFDAFLAKIPPAKQDATILLLAAEAAAAANDREKARRLYDQVITAAPKSVIGFIKRARFNWDDPTRDKDVEADLEQARRVDPNDIRATVLRSKRFRETRRDDLAIQELKNGVALDPTNEQLRLALVQTYNELGRFQEAALALDDAVQATQGALQWRARAAEAWTRIGKFDRAAEHWAAVWKDRKTTEVGGALADNLLRSGTPGDINAAASVLSAPEIAGDNSLSMRMLRARLKAKRGLTVEAATDIATILREMDTNNRGMVGGFMSDLSAMYARPSDLLAALDKLESGGPFTGYMALQAATIRLRTDETRPKAVSALEALVGNAQDPRLKAAAYAALGTLAYQDGQWESARQNFQKGLELDPGNVELANNMAYVLGVKLGKGAEALPYAQKAVAAAPSSSGFRDTLGAVYLVMGDNQKAAQELTAALATALNDTERLPVYIHLGTARLGLNDKVEARRNANEARQLIGADEAMRRAYEDDLKALERKLDGQ